MRCDGRPDGCAPCVQNQTPCKTTDRMTGIANERGHVKRLEQRIKNLEKHIRGLEDRLTSVGEDVKLFGLDSDPDGALLQWDKSNEQQAHQTWETRETGPGQYAHLQDPTELDAAPDRLPDFRRGLTGNNYLGVSSGNSFISSIRGTAMNMLGAEIDLADYTSSDLDEPDQPMFEHDYPLNKSYHAFVRTAYGGNSKAQKIGLPPPEEGVTYLRWYIRIVYPYMPFLHKPTLVRMVLRIYDKKDPYEPSVAETVMVHMLFAIMYFQCAVRNFEDASQKSKRNDLSNRHYHYAMSFFPQLMANHTLQDVQALTMIALHARSFPKPCACWMLLTSTFNLAIELGLHRSVKRWSSSAPKKSLLEIEIRKRTFWSILLMHTSVCGKLGRPMPLREEDFDVELPEPVDDELLTEDGIDVSRQGKCEFLVAVETYKILPATLDLYRSVYSIKRSPRTYIENVNRLEQRFQQWHDQWPQEMKVGDASRDEEGYVHVQYLNISGLECRLLLRHPSLSLTTVAEFNEENLSVCIDVSRQILRHVKVLQKYKSLGTNWQSGALYILAISTTLFGHWERANSITPAELATLRQDMYDWLSIIGDVSELLGSGKRLQEAVRVTVEKTLHSLEQHLTSKLGSFAPTSTKSTVISKRTSIGPQPTHHGAYGQRSAYVHYSSRTVSASDNAQGPNPQNAFQPVEGTNTVAQSAMQYTSSTQYPFLGSASSYASTSDHYGLTAYTPGEHLPSNSQEATAAAANAYLYNSSPPAPSSYEAGIGIGYNTGRVSSWREWAGHMAAHTGLLLNQPQQPEHLSSATALMQLGGRSGQGDDVNAQAAADLGAMAGATGHHWPLMIFDDSHPGV